MKFCTNITLQSTNEKTTNTDKLSQSLTYCCLQSQYKYNIPPLGQKKRSDIKICFSILDQYACPHRQRSQLSTEFCALIKPCAGLFVKYVTLYDVICHNIFILITVKFTVFLRSSTLANVTVCAVCVCSAFDRTVILSFITS